MAFQVGPFQTNFQQTAGNLVTVPDVVGQTEQSGTDELTAVLFAVSVVYAASSTVARGLIISQSPAAGVDALEGSTVTITVSLGSDGAAKGDKRHRRRRYVVEIDGQHFPVKSAEDARALLTQARALAERRSEITADRVVRRLSRKSKPVPEIKLATPVITVSPEIEADTKALRKDIERLYKKAAMNAEIRLLMLKKMADEDDEDDLLLLL